MHTLQPSKIKSSYLQRIAETYSFSCAINHVASCSWLLSVLLVACCMIWRYCLPLVWSVWVHWTCLLLPSWMWVVPLWVCLVWVPHFVFFLLWPQPWPILLLLLLQPLPVLLPFNSWHHVMFLTLVKITLVDAYMHIYCCCMNLRVCVYLHVHIIIYTMIMHCNRLYTWCLLAMLIIWCWMC